MEATIEQATGSLNEIVKAINNRCGGLVLGDFHIHITNKNCFLASMCMKACVYIEMREATNTTTCTNRILERSIIANNEMIDLLNNTNQKLEELKKEL